MELFQDDFLMFVDRALDGMLHIVEELGERSLNGIKNSIGVYAITGERALASRFEARAGDANDAAFDHLQHGLVDSNCQCSCNHPVTSGGEASGEDRIRARSHDRSWGSDVRIDGGMVRWRIAGRLDYLHRYGRGWFVDETVKLATSTLGAGTGPGRDSGKCFLVDYEGVRTI